MSDDTVLPRGQPVLRVVPMPADANFHGDIFGGWIMSHVDIAGAIPASRRARGRVATVAVNSFIFKEPVLIGDVAANHVGRGGRTGVRLPRAAVPLHDTVRTTSPTRSAQRGCRAAARGAIGSCRA